MATSADSWQPWKGDSWVVNNEVAMEVIVNGKWPLDCKAMIVPADDFKGFGMEDWTKYALTSESGPRSVTLRKEMNDRGKITIRMAADSFELKLTEGLKQYKGNKAVVICADHNEKFMPLVGFPLADLGDLRVGDAVVVSQAPTGLFQLA